MSVAISTVRDLDFTPQGKVTPSPRDWRDEFIYFLLVDRFDDNNELTPAYDPSCAPKGRDPGQGGVYQHGKLKGVTRRLDYIKNLGCTTIWLSPILKNRIEKKDSYHGYGIQNFLEVNPEFGNIEELRELVNTAHAKGMHVILDIIINHTGDNWAYPGDNIYNFWPEAPGPFDIGFWRENDPAPGFQDNDAAWPSEFQNPDFYKRRGQIDNWYDKNQTLNGDFCSLKELDTTRRDTLDALIRCYKYWIKAVDIDGYRLDTVKHLENSSTAIFCNAIREYAKRIGKDNFFIFGEIVDEDRTMESYIGCNSLIEGTNERFPSLDAALDFPLYFILEEALKGFASPALLRERYERFKNNYADHGQASKYFVSFVDNHDQMARPYRRFMHNNAHGDQMALAIGYLLTAQGIPCIYYGSEQGFDGGGDNDSYVRECMFGGKWGAFDTTGYHFFNEQHPIYRKISEIARVRAQEAALKYGRIYFREISSDERNFMFPCEGTCTLAFSRVLDSDEVAVAMNLSTEPRQDFITVDRNLTPPGRRMVDLLNRDRVYDIRESRGRAYVQVPLDGHQIAIMKLIP